MYYYHAFGLNIKSELFLSSMLAIEQVVPETFDVEIKVDFVSSKGLQSATVVKPLSQTSKNELWFSVPSVGKFYVKDGKKIVVDMLKNADKESIETFILDSCFGALLHQRASLVLEASSICTSDGCALFMGHAGNGKSTLAASFYKNGYKILTDTLAVVDETMKLQPSYPQLKLWPDSMKKLDLNVEGLQRVRPQIKKISLPVNEAFYPDALIVKIIYILHSHNQDKFIFEMLKGMKKFEPLKNHIYRSDFSESFGMKGSQLKLISKLASQTTVVKISYPNREFQIDELNRLVEEDMRSRNLINEEKINAK